jgi:serine/threonine protein kinase
VSSDSLSELSIDDRDRLEALLVEFDLNWTPERLAVVASELPADGPFRNAALREMAKIDLERHARRGQIVPLEHYRVRFPEIFDSESTQSHLIAAAQESRETLPRAGASGSVHLPKQFGRYRVVRPLGRGGMGGVYLARDGDLERLVALKVPRFPPDDAEAVERFTREAKAAATIDHPNICRVYDVGRIDGLPYISMEYVEGPTLADMLKAGPLPTRRAVEIVRDVARALAAAHRLGVVHRDLKPANILLRNPERDERSAEESAKSDPAAESRIPVVTDFGLARRDAPDDVRLTAEGVVAGTPMYMSPEQVAGDRAGPASDVYSLGVVLYEMTTGRTPFSGTRTEIFSQTLANVPPTPSTLRPEIGLRLDAIALKALAKRPADRFAGMSEFANALDNWLSETNRAERTRGWDAVRIAILAGAALIFLGVAALLIRYYGEPTSKSPTTPPNGTTGSNTTNTSSNSGTRPAIKIPPPKFPGKPTVLVDVPIKESDWRILAVAFSSDDRSVFTAYTDKTYVSVRRWNAETGIAEPGDVHKSLHTWGVFSPDGRRFLIGGGLPATELRRTESGERVLELTTGANATIGAVSRDGQRVIVCIDDLGAGRRVRVLDAALTELAGEYAGHKEVPRCIALSDDGTWAFSASADRYAAWEVKTGKAPFESGKNAIRAAAFIPKSRRIVLGSGSGVVSICDPAGTFKADPFVDPHKDSITCLAVSPDGKMVVAGAADKSLRAWDVTTKRRKWEVSDLPEPTIGLAFSSDGKLFVTAGAQSWRIWELPE